MHKPHFIFVYSTGVRVILFIMVRFTSLCPIYKSTNYLFTILSGFYRNTTKSPLKAWTSLQLFSFFASKGNLLLFNLNAFLVVTVLLNHVSLTTTRKRDDENWRVFTVSVNYIILKWNMHVFNTCVYQCLFRGKQLS